MNVIVMNDTIYYDISSVVYKDGGNIYKLGQMPTFMERMIEKPMLLLNKFNIFSKQKESLQSLLNFMNDSRFTITNHKLLKLFNEDDCYEVENQLSEIYIRRNYDSDVFYKNFPEEVKRMSDEELYFNAMIYYLCGEEYGVGIGNVRIFNEVKKARKKLKVKKYRNLKIKLINFNQLLTDLINLKQLNEFQLSLVNKLLDNNKYYMGDLNDIVSREHKALILRRKALNKTIEPSDINSSNDLLNIMISEPETSWNKATLIKPSRFLRRFIINSLERFLLRDELRVQSEIKRKVHIWKDIFNLIHVFEYKAESIKNIANYVYNNKNIPSTYTDLEMKLKAGDLSFLDDFINNPTEIYRRLNHISSIIALDQDMVKLKRLYDFIGKTIHKVPTDILCMLYKHNTILHKTDFNSEEDVLKGYGLDRIVEYNNNLQLIPATNLVWNDSADELVYNKSNSLYRDEIKLELKNRFNKFNSINIDEKYLDVVIPFKQKGNSQLNTTLASGSRLKIEDPNNNGVRFFTYWKGNSVDLDLSVYLYDKDFNSAGFIGFQHLRQNGLTHSGDITTAPNGASEYIDVEFDKIDPNIKYIMMYVNSYIGQLFDEIEDCYAGMMIRPLLFGPVFDIKTVENTFKLTSKSKTTYPILIDVEKKELIVIDKTIQTAASARAASGSISADNIIAEYYIKRNFFTIRDYLDIMDIPIDDDGENFGHDIIFNNLELLQKIIKVTT